MKKRRFLSALLAVITAAGTAIGAAGAASAADTSPYKDVKTKRWSYPEIMYATENGYMNGMGGGYFKPEDTMTRAMVVTVLYRFQGSPEVQYKKTFSDIKEKDWYADAVLWAAENDIVNGVSEGVFAPMDNITRQQLAAILMRYAPKEYVKTDNRKDITGYKDYKKVQAYAKDAMSWANATGLITGVTTSTLEPTSGATREQFAVILKRFKEGEGFDYETVYNTPVYSTSLDQSIELVTDADIYVAVDGNDSNAGTLDKPIATFARAKEMVRELKKTATDEIVVAFKAGNYGSLDNITFEADDSGSEDVPIRYTAYGDGEVVFSNGITIKNEEFTPIDADDKSLFNEKYVDNIYKVDLSGKIDSFGDKNALFSSEYGICDEARYPNKDSDGTTKYLRGMLTVVDKYSSVQLTAYLPSMINKLRTTDGMKMCGHIRRGYLMDTLPVKSYDPDTGIVTFDFENYDFEGTFPLSDEDCIRYADEFYFQNLADFLDDVGEYWFDNSTKTLYVFDPQGDYTISIGSDTFITLESGAENISFVGLGFDGTSASVIVSEGESITIDRCSISNIRGLAALDFSKARNITVTNCEFSNFVNCAILLKEASDVKRLISGNTVIENNYFHDFGQPQYFYDSVAVSLYETIDGRVAHNVFKNGAHGAVELNECIDTAVEYNVFDRMILTTGDYGAVYMYWSLAYRSNKIRYNLFCNIAGSPGYGIYVDDMSSEHEIYGNIFYNAGVHAVTLNGGRDNEVHDNIIIVSNKYGFDFLLYNDGMYIHRDWIGGYINYTKIKPSEGEDGYELWRNRWPYLYEFTSDESKIGEYNCVYTTINYIKNNAMIGTELEPQNKDATLDTEIRVTYHLYGVLEGNKSFENDENPFFANPTRCDYTVVTGAGVIGEEYIEHMNMAGLK